MATMKWGDDMWTIKKRETHFCKLDDGSTVPYDAAGDSPDTYADWNVNYEYIGEGVVWEINGVQQNSDRKSHFFRRAE